ncbi:beta-ribofuranosylaminobenzene 5'-phosphate synthase family protein [Thermococcus sp.]|uniref:beta-ribofuranosylaminobenzene 5'-phosphate synthase family protein n=1 Tax=Thermococcus sp. TaxID=35749 RepID=UPI002621E737|nr:beta-ribofuranosylaminobenzene 5'-phosphate synthase family protein [Thermococcus sp.]
MIVRTPRRLHLGLIDPTGSLGRRFGSLGVALEGGYELRVLPYERTEIIAEGEDKKTISEALRRMNSVFNTGMNYYVEVRKSIPRHVGLGSTTQLSLAVGRAVARLGGLRVSALDIARALGRGENSGAGIYSFTHGGFVLDGGVSSGLPPLILREEVPSGWAFLLVIPEVEPGLDEDEERPVMDSTFGSVEVAREISHRTLLGLLPALKEGNIRAFGEHLSAIQRLVGMHFKEFQGGEFREDVRLVLEFLQRKTYGAGQSSWGPTVYGVILKSEFQRLSVELHDYLKNLGIEAKVELGLPRNRGAEVVEENAFIQKILRSVTG